MQKKSYWVVAEIAVVTRIVFPIVSPVTESALTVHSFTDYKKNPKYNHILYIFICWLTSQLLFLLSFWHRKKWAFSVSTCDECRIIWLLTLYYWTGFGVLLTGLRDSRPVWCPHTGGHGMSSMLSHVAFPIMASGVEMCHLFSLWLSLNFLLVGRSSLWTEVF